MQRTPIGANPTDMSGVREWGPRRTPSRSNATTDERPGVSRRLTDAHRSSKTLQPVKEEPRRTSIHENGTGGPAQQSTSEVELQSSPVKSSYDIIRMTPAAVGPNDLVQQNDLHDDSIDGSALESEDEVAALEDRQGGSSNGLTAEGLVSALQMAFGGAKQPSAQPANLSGQVFMGNTSPNQLPTLEIFTEAENVGQRLCKAHLWIEGLISYLQASYRHGRAVSLHMLAGTESMVQNSLAMEPAEKARLIADGHSYAMLRRPAS